MLSSVIIAVVFAMPAVMAAPTSDSTPNNLQKRAYPNVGFGQQIQFVTEENYWVVWQDGKSACPNKQVLTRGGYWGTNQINKMSGCDGDAFTIGGQTMKFGGCGFNGGYPTQLLDGSGNFIRSCEVHEYKITCPHINQQHDIVQHVRCNA